MRGIILSFLLLLPSVTFAASPRIARCVPSQDEVIAGVDLKEVRRVWLSWTNAERKIGGLKPFTANQQLDHSAVTWSKFSRDKGEMSHKRDRQTAYYDYAIITKWFANLGLTFQNRNRMTYSESIGYGPYNCSQEVCTQKLISSLRSTFDFYLKEKNQKSRPHYGAIVNPEFKIQGMGIAIDPKAQRYYVTTHYATAITSKPSPICP
jgi:hypothetical protein